MPNKSIKELENESEKYFKSAKRWENVAKGAKVADTVLGVGAAVGGPAALVGRAALKKGMKVGAKKMMGGGASKGSDRLKKSIISKSKSKAPPMGQTVRSGAMKRKLDSERIKLKPSPRDAAAKYVKEFKTRDFKKDVRTKKPSIYPKAAVPVAAGTAAGFVAGNKAAKKKTTSGAAASAGASSVGGMVKKAVKPTKPAQKRRKVQLPTAPRALPVKPPMEVIPRATRVEPKTPRYKKGATLPYAMGGTGGKQGIPELDIVGKGKQKPRKK